MLTCQNIFTFRETYPLKRLGKKEELLFFDIETTGFSGDYSTVYLIGCVYFKNNSWNLIQWFADTLASEREVLCAFFEFLKGFQTLIHFNGDGFDLPFLLKRCLAHKLAYDFSAVESFDIYRKINPYRKLLGLASMKQKALEEFLQISRKDTYSGGQLIEVYKDYLLTRDSYLLKLLILHNEDDLKGMPLILPVLSYPDFLGGKFLLEKQEIFFQENNRELFGKDSPALRLLCKAEYPLPVPFCKTNSLVTFNGEGDFLTAEITLYEGELLYFYPDYKNYYYLIYEDRAIHKSVAEYVDKEARRKATAKTCYLRRQGRYFPQFSSLFSPFLQKNFKDKITYLPYETGFFEQEEQLQTYLCHLADYLCKS